MELLYIYIHNFKELRCINLNFSTDLIFNFDTEKCILKIDLRVGGYNIFKNENIKNITAIVGINGSGKTSILEFLYSHLFNFSKNGKFDYIAVVKNDKGEIRVLLSGDLKCKVKSSNKEYGSIPVIKLNNNIDSLGNLNADVVYFSNIIDGESINSFKEFFKNYPNLISVYNHNISSNYYLFDYQKSFSIGQYSTNESYLIKNIIDSIVFYRRNWIREKISIPFKFPDSIEIIFHFSVNSTNIGKPVGRYFDDLKKVYQSGTENYGNLEAVSYQFYWLLLWNTIWIDKNIGDGYFDNLDSLDNLLSKVSETLNVINSDASNNIYSFFTLFLDFIKNHEKNVDVEVGTGLPIFEEYSSTKIKINGLDKFTEGSNELWSDLEVLVRSYKRICDDLQFSFFSFKWCRLSSGEIAILNLFSRLNMLNTDLQLKTSNILLFLDEIDAFLHPEWQSKLMNSLLSGLLEIFPEKKFQIVLTSHSPILLSDFPSSNVIRLNKIDGQVLVANNDTIQTFGANIFDLYNDSFFLEEGTIGQFAMERIKYAISVMSNKESSQVERDDASKIVELIGDDLIKYQLHKLSENEKD